MCAQVADHSRCMDALGEFHAKGHSPRDSQQVQYFNYARKRSGIHGLREPDIDDAAPERDSRSKSWSRLVWSISVCSVRKYLIPAIYSLIPSRAARWAIVIKARLSIQTARTANLHHRDDFHRQF